jgi:phage terminase small subunit
MAGRKAKPIQLHLADGKSRLTKADIQKRKDLEAKNRFGNYCFRVPSNVKADKIALQKWKEITKLYRDGNVDFVTTADTAILMQYCLTYAEYVYLIEARKEIIDKGYDKIKTYHAIEELGIDHNINKKNELLSRLGKILYLDPQSRLGKVCEEKSNKPTELEDMGFGGI